MKLRNIGSNMTEVEEENGTKTLFSYSTPVAAWISGEGYYRTEAHYSSTTTRHINKWLNGAQAEIVPQDFFDH
jgi:hypothetical protein